MLAGECQGGVPRWYAESSAAAVRQACPEAGACADEARQGGRQEASAAAGENMAQLREAGELMSRSEKMRDAKQWFALDLLLLGVGVLCLIAYCRRLLGPEDDELC
ncbi:hypothetical protein C2I19_08535 [Chromobacterium alticapitis]|uniref:Uncharacterized protein n=2 Tax=Chromobacterium alticapitis TaxID=2073169 RepID=A0A2S5DHA1_9NEIS|nr:hypothetical protein C2I19_08535 [Chromobacterium alticapitis]